MPEYCAFGKSFGVYVVGCAESGPAFLSAIGRIPGDGTRIIQLVGDLNHDPHPSGACEPMGVPYGSRIASKIKDAIDRAIVAGESVWY